MKNFLDIKIGDIVKVYDTHARGYETHRIKVDNIDYKTSLANPPLNPRGKRCHGKDLDRERYDGNHITTVDEINFIDIIEDNKEE